MATATRRCALKTCGLRKPQVEMIIKGVMAWCGIECQLAHAMKNLGKLQSKEARDATKAKKEAKQKNAAELRDFRARDLPHQLEATRKVFNTMIRLLDRGKLCPTCGEPLVEGSYDAGHVRTVASCPQLRFHACACFGQCRRCNGSGTIRRRTRKTQEVVSELYKAWVLKELGQAHYDWLYGPHPTIKWNCPDLIAFRVVLNSEIRLLEKGLPPSREWRKLPTQSNQEESKDAIQEKASCD